MKLYNVNVYTLSHSLIECGKLLYLDKIVVEKKFFAVREIITKEPLMVVSADEHLMNRLNFYKYDKDGYLLTVKKEELIDKKKATIEDVEDYVNRFNDSNISRVFKKMKCFPKRDLKELVKIYRKCK